MENIQKELQNRIGELIGKDYFKLEFGCKFRAIKEVVDGAGYGIVISDDVSLMNSKGGHSEVETSFIFYHKDLFEIIGQEPSLNDVLMALEENKGGSSLSYCMYSTGELSVIDYGENGDESMTIKYDLSKSLFQQDEETLQAIYNLLKSDEK